ncbi:hypothetical protein Hanom_Chr06g00535571 [Helianthus anomalus]
MSLSLSPLLSILPPSCATTQDGWPTFESVTEGVSCVARKSGVVEGGCRKKVSMHYVVAGKRNRRRVCSGRQCWVICK